MQVQKAVESVMRFYGRQGVGLSYAPKVLVANFAEQGFPLARFTTGVSRHSTAIEDVGKYAHSILARFIGTRFEGRTFEEKDIDIMFGKPSEKHSKQEAYFRQTGADILINSLTREPLEGTLAHEIWHLIEGEHGLLQGFWLIREGTAEYAKMKFNGWKSTLTFDKCKDYSDGHYRGVANVIERRIGQGGYAVVLDPEFRRQVQEESLPHLIQLHLKGLNELEADLKRFEQAKAIVEFLSGEELTGLEELIKDVKELTQRD